MHNYPVEFYEDANGEHRWRIMASNNEIVGASTEGFKNQQDCLRNLELVVQAAGVVHALVSERLGASKEPVQSESSHP